MKLYITLESDNAKNKIESIVNITKETNLETIIPTIESMVDTISNPNLGLEWVQTKKDNGIVYITL